MSSASSTARCIHCTVDSILTTTPFLRPREGWLPMPITSSAPSAVTSPTSASTLEVPMSRPTITSLSTLLANAVRSWGRRGLSRMAAAFPAHCKAVAVTQIDVGDVGGALIDQLRGDQHEALQTRIDLLPPETHLHAVVER